MSNALAQLKELSNEELRVRVAEACGWTFIEKLAYTGIPKGSRGNADARVIPEYSTSLDAIAEAEKTLMKDWWEPGSLYRRYKLALVSIQGMEESDLPLECASARHRAIAFVFVRGHLG